MIPCFSTIINAVKRIILLGCFLHSGVVFSQPFKSPVVPITDMRFETIDDRNGLHNLVLGDFRQDRQGYIWIASQDGLHRYDGKNFRVYLEENGSEKSVMSNWVTSLETDRQGRIWLAYFGGGFSIYDPGTETFKHFPSGKNGLSDKTIFYLFCDSDGDMWAHFGPDEIGRIYAEQPIYRKLNPDVNVTHTDKLFASFQEDLHQQGLIWITGTGVFSYNKHTQEWKSYEMNDPSIPLHNIHAYTNMRQLSDGRLVLSAWGSGITVLDPSNGKLKRYLPEGICKVEGTHNIIYWLDKRDEHSVWINSSVGFGYFDVDEEVFHIVDPQVAAKYNLPNANLGRLYRDRENNIWIGHALGINLLKNNYHQFLFHPVNVSHSDNGDFYSVSKILIDSADQVRLIGTAFADGLHIDNLRTGTSTTLHIDYYPATEHSEMVQDLLKDDAGNYWVLTRDFIYRLDIHTPRLEKIKQNSGITFDSETPYLLKFYYTGGDSVWIGSYRAGLLCMNVHTGQIRQYRHSDTAPNTISADYVGDMQLDNKGRMWIRSKRKVIDVIDFKSGTVFQVTPHELRIESENFRFTGIGMDAAGNIWVSGNTGLYYTSGDFNGPVIWNELGPIEGVTTRFFYGVVFDKNNYLWSLSPAGLFMIDPVHKKAERFTSGDGLGNDYNNSSIIIGKGDWIYIGYWKGYYAFRYTRTHQQRLLIPRLASFSVWNKPVYADSSGIIRLKADENSISIDFTVVDFLHPDKLLFATKLEGLEERWSEATDRRYASFPRLPGGEYRFLVRVIDERGEWGEPRELARFVIATPFWKQSWFIITSSLIFALVIFGLYRYRIRRVQKEEALKTQFNKRLAEAEMRALRAQMNPHFIFNCLNSINRYIVKSDQLTASMYLTKFSKLIRLILDNSNHKTVSLDQDLEALRIYIEMEALRFDNKFEFSIAVEEATTLHAIQVPPMIFQPFVENAIWHGLLHKEGRGRMSIRIAREKRLLSVIIEDNGIGRKKAAELRSKSATTRKSLGMQLTEERMQLLKAELKTDGLIMVEDLEDEEKNPLGTRVTILLPIEE